MEAIKNLRESSVLLSNLNISSYNELAERIYSFSRVEECLYYDTDEEESMGWVEKIVLDSAEARDRGLMADISMFATEEEYRILYSKLCGMAQLDYWLDLDMELTRNAAIAAEEMAREIDQEIKMSYAYSPEEEMDDHIVFCASLDQSPVRPKDPHSLPF